MDLKNFWLSLDALTNKPEAHPDIEVKLMTLEGEFPVGHIELQKDDNGNTILSIQSDEPVYREPWD